MNALLRVAMPMMQQPMGMMQPQQQMGGFVQQQATPPPAAPANAPKESTPSKDLFADLLG